MASTWNTGYWGQNNYGDQSNVTVEQTGFSLSSTLGTISISAEINLGWGRLTWGENAWGAGGDVVLQGQQLTSAINSVTPQAGASAQPTGISASFSLPGTVTFDIGADVVATGTSATATAGSPTLLGDANLSVTGSSTTTNIGSVTVDARIETGWGRGTWGNRAWGDAYTVIAQGQQATTAQGTVVGFTDVTVSVSGQQLLTITQGQESIQIDTDIYVFVAEHTLETQQGTFTLIQSTNETAVGQSLSGNTGQVVAGTRQDVPVTQFGMTSSLGSISLVQSTNEPVTGSALSSSLGTIEEIPGQIIGLSGFNLPTGIGSVVATGTASTTVSGIGLTASIGTLNITAWAEIDLGVNNVWTEVDLAA